MEHNKLIKILEDISFSSLAKEKAAHMLLEVIESGEKRFKEEGNISSLNLELYRHVSSVPEWLLSLKDKIKILEKGISYGSDDCAFEKAYLQLENKLITKDDYISVCRNLSLKGQKDAVAAMSGEISLNECSESVLNGYLKMLCDSFDAERNYYISFWTLVDIYFSYDENKRKIINSYASDELKRILNVLADIDRTDEDNEYLMDLFEDEKIPRDYSSKIFDFLIRKRKYSKAFDYYVIFTLSEFDDEIINSGRLNGSKECESVVCDRKYEKTVSLEEKENLIKELEKLSSEGSVYAAFCLAYIYTEKDYFNLEKSFLYCKRVIDSGFEPLTNDISDFLYNVLYETYHFDRVIEEKAELFTQQELLEYESPVI